MSDELRAWLAEAIERHHVPLRDTLDQILTELKELKAMSTTTTNSIAALTAAVAAETAVDTAVETLLTNLSAQITAASPTGDNPAIDALVTTMQTNAAALGDAVKANTPAA